MPRKKKEEVDKIVVDEDKKTTEKVVEKKKRGRKPKKVAEEIKVYEEVTEEKEVEKEDKEESKKEKKDSKEEINREVKKLNIISYLLVGIGFVMLCVLVSATSKYRLNGEAKSHLIDIDYNKFTELIKGNDKSVVMVGRPTCSHCVSFKPVITKVANDYEVDIYYLNTDEIIDEDDFNDLWDFIEASGTPTTVIVGGDKLISRQEGEMTREQLVNWLGENGVI